MRKIGTKWVDNLSRLLVCTSLTLAPLMASSAEEDPYERVNRAIFSFNETLDTYALKPIAKGYRAITPQFLEDGVHNFFGNLGEARNLTHDLLQGKVRAAGVDTSRFLFNTTLGGLGFVDVATRMGLQRNDEDLGQTLGTWGVESGPYIVIPLLGPSSVRDGLARVPDSYLQPYPYMNDVSSRNALRGVDLVDTRASFLDAEKMVTGDKYIFLRNAYLQNREFRVKDGQVEDDF
jgi:phospholipid-binding lipoprotein MlaA